MTLLAWQYSNSDEPEDGCGIAFGERVADLVTDDGEKPYRPKRRPEFDQFAAQSWVPAELLIEIGWQLPCGACDHLIDGDGCSHQVCLEDCGADCSVDEYPVAVFERDKAYCAQSCLDSERERKRARAERRELEAMVAADFEREFPGARRREDGCSCGVAGEGIQIDFVVPGCIGHVTVTWEPDAPPTNRPMALVQKRDLAAWFEFRRSSTAGRTTVAR